MGKRVCLVFLSSVLLVGPLLAAERGIVNTWSSPHVELRSIDMADCHWTQGFWADRFALCRDVMVPHMWAILSDPKVGHAWQNFRIADGLEQGQFKGMWWHDGDFYKWLEACAHVYAITRDKELDQLMDRVIAVVGQAQEADGYLSTAVQIRGVPRWDKVVHHELYNMGHLHTAGCIHFRITGKKTLLDVACKNADYLHQTFKDRDAKLANFGFNPSQIMGLVELYRTVGDRRYLELARIFVDNRGRKPARPGRRRPMDVIGGTDFTQDRMPLLRETEAVGHVVTAEYLWAGAADIVAETGEKALRDSLDRMWKSVVEQKMYITGGNAAVHRGVSPRRDYAHETFGRPYELPHATAYNETCSSLSLAMWNWRMLALTGEAKYADVVERVLYNSGLSGISLDGKHYYYTNPLRQTASTEKFLPPYVMHDDRVRKPYLSCFCCPPNIVRTVAKVSGWAYSVSDAGLWVHLYGSNKLKTRLPGGTVVCLTQTTTYPWDGQVTFTIDQAITSTGVMLRIPGWATDATVTVNSQPFADDLSGPRYLTITRAWKAGDRIELTLPMPVQIMESHPLIEETRNQGAVQRGPVVYCLESTDLPEEVHVLDVSVPDQAEWEVTYDKDLLEGVCTLSTQAVARVPGATGWTGQLYRARQSGKTRRVTAKLIPYFAWNNRGKCDMTVWMPITK